MQKLLKEKEEKIDELEVACKKILTWKDVKDVVITVGEEITGGTMYYRPQKCARVLVTVDKESHVTSYTKISSELNIELDKNGLKNIIFSMGHAMVKYSNYHSGLKPKLENNDTKESKKLLEEKKIIQIVFRFLVSFDLYFFKSIL